MPKNQTLKVVAGIAASFTGLAGTIIFLLGKKIISVEISILMLVALLAMSIASCVSWNERLAGDPDHSSRGVLAAHNRGRLSCVPTKRNRKVAFRPLLSSFAGIPANRLIQNRSCREPRCGAEL